MLFNIFPYLSLRRSSEKSGVRRGKDYNSAFKVKHLYRIRKTQFSLLLHIQQYYNSVQDIINSVFYLGRFY